MLSHDNFQAASQYSKITHTFLNKYEIPPTPVNYSVIYLYTSNLNAELKKEIDRQITATGTVDAIFIDHLFIKFVSNAEHIEKSILTPFEASLSEILDKMNQQAACDKILVSHLEKADKALAKTEHHKSLHKVVNFLFGTINSSQLQHRALSEELAKTCEEVTLLKAKLQESRQEAIVDALTGLLNRRGCDDLLKDINIDDVHCSLAIDIDHFKKINDQFGHFVGDKVIQRVASVIKDNVGENDLAVRYGGEEFVVVMVNKAMAEAKKVAEEIRQAINELKLVQRQTNVFLPPISVSIGIAELDNDVTWPSLFKRADQALYQAKNAGRNCCICA